MVRNFVNKNLTRATLVVVGVGILASIGVSPAWADPPDAREVSLQLTIDGAGNCSISVYPETATISRGQNQKIKKVYWVAPPNSQFPELYWELRWDPDKRGASEDYFGAVDLPCGVNNIKVQPHPKPKIPQAQWPYAVSVYSCSDGAKSQNLCTVDPRIRWDD